MDIIKKGLNANRESKYIEFKGSFDINSKQEWCEVIKDIIAISNSGGGVIIFGLKSNGTPSGCDLNKVLNIDPAEITDKIYKYTNYHFSEFEITEHLKSFTKIMVLRIHPASVPVIFSSPGTYDIGGGKQKSAFSKGTIYFRHGAKSEPGNIEDLRKFIDRQVNNLRKSWLKDVRRVVQAPIGSRIAVLPQKGVESTSL